MSKFNAKPPNPQNTRFLSGYAFGDDAEIAETGHRMKSQSYFRARPKMLER